MLPTAPLTFRSLTFRTIDLSSDADLVVAHQRDACVATYGDERRFQGVGPYLSWLRSKIEEFPDGNVLAFTELPRPGEGFAAWSARCVGHLELQAPYGLGVGYVNLFYVRENFRGQGFGRRLQEYAERYFRAWEARAIELHVSASNERARGFYRHLGYRLAEGDETGLRLWKMVKVLA